ncbi:MAG: RDD family protein [Methanothrix sp.]|nr:MAG: RDD family protein [Methanothrix sp.]
MANMTSASWGERLWAWLIDVLLVGILWASIITISSHDVLSPGGLGIFSSLLFVYWTVLEGYRGQSLGKMFMNIVVTGPVGETIGFQDSAIESFGKAFLLPLDCLVGWIAFRGSGQRAFNRFSNTIVTKPNDLESCQCQL